MKTSRTLQQGDSLKAVRCAVYTRKSTEEGLQQDFNTLDAQRESAEAYIFSQQHEGWTCLPERYDDGGFTGGNMDRPALQHLLADIEAGRVDAVVVYKVDRLSRSLLDFAKMLEIFDRHQVAFVSVTQQINSATSMGRLMLNVLLSFAQFEREIIGERTRDKIAATRRKGKWSGGRPLLGYDVDPHSTRLVVNEDEAVRVRAIFDLYLQHESLLPVVQELERRGWTNKRWQTRAGKEADGGPLDKTALHRLLINPLYSGRVKYKRERHAGEQAAIVEPAVFDRVQTLLKRHSRTGGASVHNEFGAILKGLLRCGACGCAMTPAHSTKKRTRRYRYYVCSGAQKRGWATCPSKSVPAAELEQFVIDRIRCVGKDPALLQATVAEACCQDDARLADLEADRRGLERDLGRLYGQEREHARPLSGPPGEDALARLAEVQEQIRQAESKQCRLKEEIGALRRGRLDEKDYADLGRLGHVTRARVSQIMALLCLAPDIQEKILFWPPTVQGKDRVQMRQVRPIAAVADWKKQRQRWRELR